MTDATCELLPVGELDAVLKELASSPHAHSTRQVTTCRYTISPTRSVLTFGLTMSSSRSDFLKERAALEQRGVHVSIEPGLGDEAYSYSTTTDGAVMSTLVVVRNNVVMEISAPESMTSLRRLARYVIPSL